MKLIKMIKNFIFNPVIRLNYLQEIGFYNYLSDENYLKKKYLTVYGHELNLESPQKYSEKLQWLKLKDRKEIYTTMVDKVLAKQYVADKIGEQYIIPTLKVWDSVEEINFDELPNQFVLKCNHNSGLGMCVCNDKSKLNIGKVKHLLKKGLKQNYYLTNREWPYKNVNRKILAEKYMVDNNCQEDCLIDYKFFCFHGKVQFMYISRDAATNATTDFFDADFNLLPIRMKDPNSEVIPKKPSEFEKMVDLAEILSAGCPHVRVDFYFINNQIYFGEMTFYHNGGFGKIKPEEWDQRIGEYINLEEI